MKAAKEKRIPVPAKVLESVAVAAKAKAGTENKSISSKIEELLTKYVKPKK